MPLKTITFRVPDDRLKALDTLAEVQQRDSSFVLNEAVVQYVSAGLYRELIEEGIREDDVGLSIDDETARRQLAEWTGNSRAR